MRNGTIRATFHLLSAKSLSEPGNNNEHHAVESQATGSRQVAPFAQCRDDATARVFSRYVIPLGILLGFLTLFGTSIAKQLLPRKKVTVIPVIAKRGTVTSSGAVLFQAAGWVEPRPSSARVTALVGGVVDELLVVDGQEVQKGEAVAKLLMRDAELQVEQAEAAKEMANGELQRAEAEKKLRRLA